MNEQTKAESNVSLKICSKCVIPETQDTIVFDEQGVCNVCRSIEYKQTQIDWKAREKEFLELVEPFRGKYSYDCIIPFSGGKDSTFQAYTLVEKYGLKPLLVSFDHGFYRPHHKENVDRVIRKLGVDYMLFRPNWHIVRRLMLESLMRKGDFCWHCHTGIYSYPMRIAVKMNIPLIIWGESVAEYMAYYTYEQKEEVDEKRFNMFTNLGITAQDMVGMLNDPKITERDLEPYTYPTLSELKAINYKSICLGSYIPWDTRTQSELIREKLGWQGDTVEGIPDNYWYEKLECGMQGVRDYLKYIKRGFGRTAHLASIDVRNDRMDHATAETLTKEFDGKRPASLDVFLEYVGMTEEEFNKIAVSHCVAPWKVDPSKLTKGPKLHDQDQWYHEKEPMDKSGQAKQ